MKKIIFFILLKLKQFMKTTVGRRPCGRLILLQTKRRDHQDDILFVAAGVIFLQQPLVDQLPHIFRVGGLTEAEAVGIPLHVPMVIGMRHDMLHDLDLIGRKLDWIAKHLVFADL